MVKGQQGFTVLELIVACGIISILAGIAAPQIGGLGRQLKVSQDTRIMAHVLGRMRAEAIRLKTSVRMTFSLTGVSWDIGDDGSVEGSFSIHADSAWYAGATPGTIVFNGLGLARGLSSSTISLRLDNGASHNSITVNRNGHIKI